MPEKIVLVLVDGMRPEGMLGCGHPFVSELIARSTHALDARAVMPSMMLPCHMSLFHSVDPDRHGILSNTYVPQVRPIVGLFDQLDLYGKKNGFFYTWEELRDLSRCDHLHTAVCLNQSKMDDADRKITDAAIAYIRAEQPDFCFIYLGWTDCVGHKSGWLGEAYMETVYTAFDCIQKIYENLPEGYTLITTADHGGHGRSHGTDTPEDMTIPICFCGPRFTPDRAIPGVSIKDLAPTVAALLEVPVPADWDGRARGIDGAE